MFTLLYIVKVNLKSENASKGQERGKEKENWYIVIAVVHSSNHGHNYYSLLYMIWASTCLLCADTELSVDEKYKKTLEEIEALKDHLGTTKHINI